MFFFSCREHMEGYQDSCPNEVEGFRKEVKWLIVRLLQDLEDQFKEDVKVQQRWMKGVPVPSLRKETFSFVVSKRGIEIGTLLS